ncbi:MAG: ATP-binding protein [Erysipelotrichaceae bacterium]|nr:ATP-binding protein [Erysipelotrichaceae bacterium]
MKNNGLEMIRKLMFRLLPIQVLLAVVGSINNIVSSYFASNYVGIDAMGAVGLYAPASMLLGAISTLLVGGCSIICGKYLGQNEHRKLQEVFSLDLLLSTAVAVLITAAFLFMGVFHLTGIFTQDMNIRPIFDRYLIGQSIGIIPFILGNQLPAFLAMENRNRRTMAASIVYIVMNLLLDILFVQHLQLQEMGLALASSIGLWVFFIVQLQYFFSKESQLRLSLDFGTLKRSREVLSVGFPGAASYIYQTARGVIVNKLLEINIGTVAISAFAAANNLMGIFWAVPQGMLAVSRLLISISVGEEDRETLCNIMRVMMRCFLPLMCAIDVLIIIFAGPLSSIFFKDTAGEVYAMMRMGLQILPLCMPLSIIMMHFSCYGQSMNRQFYVNVLALLDGVIGVAGFSALLIGSMGIRAVYIANVLNGVLTTLFIVAYAVFKLKAFPRNMEELMVLPDDFGVAENERIDISIRTVEEVVTVSSRIHDFCRERGIDERRAYYAALSMEEMAANVVEHGFVKDNRKHSVDVRVIHKDDQVILRIKDDCVPFDPKEREKITDSGDILKNIGIRMIYRIMKDIEYRNVLGLNVLTIRI